MLKQTLILRHTNTCVPINSTSSVNSKDTQISITTSQLETIPRVNIQIRGEIKRLHHRKLFTKFIASEYLLQT